MYALSWKCIFDSLVTKPAMTGTCKQWTFTLTSLSRLSGVMSQYSEMQSHYIEFYLSHGYRNGRELRNHYPPAQRPSPRGRPTPLEVPCRLSSGRRLQTGSCGGLGVAKATASTGQKTSRKISTGSSRNGKG
jgi:hypothetical protein